MQEQELNIIEKYKTGANILSELCDYINNRAMILSALNYEFSKEELDIIKIVQTTNDNMKKIIFELDNAGNSNDDLIVDYEIYQLVCPECKGMLKVDRFLRNDMGHRFNVYKCADCGTETQDQYPNKNEHVLKHFKMMNEFFDKLFADENVEVDVKKKFRLQYKSYKKQEKAAIEANDNFILKKEDHRKSIEKATEGINFMFNELLKIKHIFDRNIGEA